MEMKQEIKEKWIAALESGEYTQGQRWLKRVDDGVMRQCCMGVLCELAMQAGVKVEEEGESYVMSAFDDVRYSFDGEDSFPPDSVRDWAGLPRPRRHNDGAIAFEPLREVAVWNDRSKMNFYQIAEEIRAEIDGVTTTKEES